MKILAILLFAASCLLVAKSSWAEVQTTVIANNVLSIKNTLAEQELKQRKVIAGLYNLSGKIKKSVVQRGKLLNDQAQLERAIEDLQEEISENTANLIKQKQMLSKRLQKMSTLGADSSARLIFGASSVSTLNRNMRILGAITKNDKELIENYSYDLKSLATRKEKLVGRLDKLKQIQGKINFEETKLLAEQTTKAKILAGIRKSTAFSISHLQELKRQAGTINLEDSGVLDLLFKKSFSELQGALPAPVRGKVVVPFGIQKALNNENKNRWTIANKGLLYEVSSGEFVRSISSGVVVYSDTIPGHGKTMIVDHGDHYYSVYAGFTKSDVRIGDEVVQSQKLASLDNAGINKLYFEIRHFSENYDPKNWIKGISL